MYKILVLIISIGLTNSIYAQEESKSSSSEKSISVRNAHSMVYDTHKSIVYLFGGANEEAVLSDLWFLNETQWEKVETDKTPSPRTFASMAYDRVNTRIVLFGGSKVLFGKTPDSDNLLNDTWVFEDNTWKKLITKNAPTPRAEATMVYDENRNKLLLFGGYTIEGKKYIKLGDTWEFYDNEWHLVSDKGPSKRHGISMSFDGESNEVILFGGSTVDKQYGERKGETWRWDGQKWNKLSIEQPLGVFNATMTYDPHKEEFVRFGGWNGKSRINTTWVFKENSWRILASDQSPSPRNHSNMVYSIKEQRIILFGGHDGKYVFGDTWEFREHKWHKILDQKPVKRVKNRH